MKQICLIGPVDKRVVAYPLLKVIDIAGKVLVVTDDANFRRFSDDYSLQFTFGRSDYIILNEITPFAIEEAGFKVLNYDYVLYVTTNTLIENNDILVYCHGDNKSICTSDILDILADRDDYKEVLLSQVKNNVKSIPKIDISKETMGYVWSCEEYKEFLPCKNVELVKTSVELFSEKLGISKEEYQKIIVRQELIV